MIMREIGQRAKAAAQTMARAGSEAREAVLLSMADHILDAADAILDANHVDVAQGRQNGLTFALLDRLTLNLSRLEGIAADLRTVAKLIDPVGEVFDDTILPNGLRVHKQRVPLGVLGVIYEARPNVTIDVAGLAVKTGNAAILRGGSETLTTNRVLVAQIQAALIENNLPSDAVQFIDDADRSRVLELLHLHEYVDLVIPRGGAGLHQFCRENSRIPVITGGIGICHLYVDKSADLEAALAVIQNAKVQRPTVCNALDTVLVHQSIAARFLVQLVQLLERDGVLFKAEERAMQALRISAIEIPASVSPAGVDDFDTEWLSLVLGLKVVSGLEEAIDHIARHSTGHSDGILTQDQEHASRFIAEVDSAAVYVNASTRFTDGAQLGLGAEVAISTQRLHARGPMGLRELTTYKWVIQGEYQVRKV